VRLRDAEVTSPPLIDPNYLADQGDLTRMLDGIVVAHPRWAARTPTSSR
jgi:hypothetical protein